jgi:uncharacterized protein involved in outer membrane biogenesis
MLKLHKRWKLALFLIVLVVVAQIAVTLTVRTQRVHRYLSQRLETAFGRPVQVKTFDLEILPSPRIYATGVTVGEDPAFGYEYFLRAEHLTAGLRWSGFLRGHFEFGTLTLNAPSLTLVRNSEGRWNLEDWLPPAKKATPSVAIAYGPAQSSAAVNRLYKINFDEGRINFKSGDVKQPFALTAVAGSVEQVAPGRWQLQIEAQPWRSGVALQSTGTVQVHGDIAGTSARLQPASLTVRWNKVSLADLARLLRGKDYGVRGTFALEASAKSGWPLGTANDAVNGSDSSNIGVWSFALRASAEQIHRWDLTERSDNPNALASVHGTWDVAAGHFTADTLSVETAQSNLHGTAEAGVGSHPFVKVNFANSGIQATDLLDWYRAFHSDVAEGITADQFFRGSLAMHGFPFTLDALDFSTPGGFIKVSGVDDTVKIPALRAVMAGNRLHLDSVHLAFVNTAAPTVTSTVSPKTRRRAPSESSGEANLSLVQDFGTCSGSLGIQGRGDKAEDVLKITSAFGYTLNHGWDLTGPARADLRREWSEGSRGVWNGSAEVTGATLAAAGLNQPVQLQQARLEWHNGKRSAQVSQAKGFGTSWNGVIVEGNSADPDEESTWNVQLHADHLDAAELDRWVGPRARPGWLQRLLPSLLGGAQPAAPASELVRRLNVSGDVLVEEFTIEKLRLQQLRLHGSLRDLELEISDGRAQWAGGALHASMLARFRPKPTYEVHAELDGVNLAQLPLDPTVADRLGGLASGTVHLKTTGVGREELLRTLTAVGNVRLADLELRGWDVNASVADGEPHAGVSHWVSGEGAFTVNDRNVFLEDVRLDGPAQTTLVNGTVSFRREADLAVESTAGRRGLRNTSTPGHILKVVGPLDEPRLSQEASAPRQPAD